MEQLVYMLCSQTQTQTTCSFYVQCAQALAQALECPRTGAQEPAEQSQVIFLVCLAMGCGASRESMNLSRVVPCHVAEVSSDSGGKPKAAEA